MKIVWLTDFTEKEHQGGAQQTNKIMIENSPYQVIVVKTKDFRPSMINDRNLFIINNIVFLSDDNLNQIISRAKYVRYCHDYECVPRLKDKKDFYNNSLMNIFLSPLHHKEYVNKIGYEIPNVEIQNSPIDTKIFKHLPSNKKKEVLWVGQVNVHKGISNVIYFAKKNKDVMINVVGFGNGDLIKKLKELPNIKFLQEIPHNLMPVYYRKYDSFIHLPEWKEPFGRTVLEAYLCGCDLIINDNLGCMSFDWDWNNYKSIKKHCEEAPKEFWNKIKQII